jgi:hypothetical protein
MGAGDLIIRRLKTKHKGTIEMPEVLMWGRMERNYARNRIITKLFEALDWEVRYFHPVSSHLGLIQAFLSKLHRPDLIWIPCFRQRDVHSAAFWSRIWSVPTIFDPITSVYEKETYERKKWPPGSGSAERRKAWEKSLFLKVDLVVLENQTYMDFIHREMNIPLNRLAAKLKKVQKAFKMLSLKVGWTTRNCPPDFPKPIFCSVFSEQHLKPISLYPTRCSNPWPWPNR